MGERKERRQAMACRCLKLPGFYPTRRESRACEVKVNVANKLLGSSWFIPGIKDMVMVKTQRTPQCWGCLYLKQEPCYISNGMRRQRKNDKGKRLMSTPPSPLPSPYTHTNPLDPWRPNNVVQSLVEHPSKLKIFQRLEYFLRLTELPNIDREDR